MANYYAATRTNYFSVTDPEKLKDIVNRINWEQTNKTDFFTEKDGQFAFGAYGSICGLKTEPPIDDECYDAEYEADAVYNALREIVAPDSAIIITEIGAEKLRYLNAFSVVITKDAIDYEELYPHTIDLAQKLTGNNAYNPLFDY